MSSQTENIPRLKDVAQRAGISETTASMVFSGKGRISKETKKSVLDAAQELGYKHQTRVSRKAKEDNCAAILILTDKESSFLWHFLTDLIEQIQKDLSDEGLKTILIPVSIHEDSDSIFTKIKSSGCTGVFALHIGKKELFDRLENAGIPVIILMNNNFQHQCFSICADDFQGAYQGTRYLQNCGHKRIDFIDDYREELPNLSSDRYFGYRKALDESGIPYKEDYKLCCEDLRSEEKMLETLKNSMQSNDPPTAYFCLDDEVAYRIWNALLNLGYKIPEDVSLIAPGDVIDYSKPFIHPITTLRLDLKDMGRLAANMLKKRLSGKVDTLQVVKMQFKLVERGSCRNI